MQSIKNKVKLNNPLMGAETINYCNLAKIAMSADCVKLNNPLMGTETTANNFSVNSLLSKLN